jgi:SAM-dependent methyltransferase
MSGNQSSDDTIRSTLAYYNTHAEDFVRRTRNVDMRPTREAFTALLPPGGRVLDAGCGSGRDSLAFLEEGFDVTAFDGSSALAELASTLTGLRVLCMPFAELTFASGFDGVWACASLLHLPPAELDDAVERLVDALKAGGTLFMSFKQGEGQAIDDGRFTSFMSDHALQALLERHPRLAVVRVWTAADAQGRPVRWSNVLARRGRG